MWHHKQNFSLQKHLNRHDLQIMKTFKHIYNLPVVHLLGKKPVNADKKLSMWLVCGFFEGRAITFESATYTQKRH